MRHRIKSITFFSKNQYQSLRICGIPCVQMWNRAGKIIARKIFVTGLLQIIGCILILINFTEYNYNIVLYMRGIDLKCNDRHFRNYFFSIQFGS